MAARGETTCCFGMIESYDTTTQSMAVRPRSGRILVERRASIPRAVIFPPPPPPPAFPYIPPAQPKYICAAVPSQEPTPAPLPCATQHQAERIAEILAPITFAARRQEEAEERKREYYALREEEARKNHEAALAQYIEEEAVRRVHQRNKREERRNSELRLLEDSARYRIENEFRTSSSSLGSQDDRVVVIQHTTTKAYNDANHRCSKCQNKGHRSRDCNAVVTVSVSRPERRNSVSYHRIDPPRRSVRYVEGV